MFFMDTLAARLKFARKKRLMTQDQLSERSGVKQSDISKLERGDSQKTTGLVALARALTVDVDWLDTGDGEMEIKPNTQRPEQPDTGPTITIPQFDTGGGMGNSYLLLDDQPGTIKSWHVDSDWVRLNVKNHTGIKNLCIVTGFGPSMRPMFNPGDPLLVDRGVTICESDAVYFFRVGKHGFIKSLQRIPTAHGLLIRAKSKNPDYDSFDIEEGMDFQVLGKVLTVWKSEQF